MIVNGCKKINKISLIFSIAFVSLLVFLWSIGNVFAVSESTNYKINGGQINSISKKVSGTLYNMETGGQTSAGKLTGSSYSIQAGATFSETVVVVSEVTPSISNYGSVTPVEESLPEIVDLRVVSISSGQARVMIETDELAVIYLEYGKANESNLFTDIELSFSYNHEFLLYNLIPNTEYSFNVHLRSVQSRQVESIIYKFTTGYIFKVVPNASNFVAKANEEKIDLFWSNSEIIDFVGIKLIRNIQHFPTDLEDGILVYDGKNESYFDYQVNPNQKYYYTLFTYDTSLNFSSGAIASESIEIIGEEIINEEDIVVEDSIEEEVLIEEEIKEGDIIIPAEPPELSVGLTPVKEEERIENKVKTEKGVVDFLSLIKQNVAKEYERLTRIFEETLNVGQKQINNIKDGLINQSGDLQQSVYEKLTFGEKKEVEKILDQTLSEEYDYEEINEIFADYFSKGKERVDSVKEGLINQAGQLQQDVYEELTYEERKKVAGIIEQPLSPTLEYNSIIKILPFSLETEGVDADWHVFTDSDSFLTISASVFDKPVNTIMATLRAEAYMLKYNENTGNYEALIKTPIEKGKYQMILQIIYDDFSYEEISKVVLVDPYGYVYIEKYKPWSWKKPWQIFFKDEIRIPTAKVIIYTLNKKEEWVIWPANFYKQFNPQTTGVTGEFLFLVPSGKYHLTAEAVGYKRFVGNEFEIEDGVVNTNIKLNVLFSWWNFGEVMFRWSIMIGLPLIFTTFLMLLWIKIGMRIGMKNNKKRINK